MTACDVSIAMATHNGARFLEQQLASIAAQKDVRWGLVASDDGSQDGTLDILKQFAQDHPTEMRQGPCRGFVANFLSLLLKQTTSRYIALCDQDDVWLPGKLCRALGMLEVLDPARPALYCARTALVDARLRTLGLSPLFRRPPSFENALVQSLAGGNTMVLNRTAVELVARQGSAHVISHDWWIYQLIAGAEGQIVYDQKPQVLYRQHSGNVCGSNLGASAGITRARAVWAGRYRGWLDVQTAALEGTSDVLTARSREILARFQAARRAPGVTRAWALSRSGAYRQRLSGQISLLGAAALRGV